MLAGSIARVFDVVDAAAGPKTRYQLVLRSPNMPSAPSASVSVLNSKVSGAAEESVGTQDVPDCSCSFNSSTPYG